MFRGLGGLGSDRFPLIWFVGVQRIHVDNAATGVQKESRSLF